MKIPADQVSSPWNCWQALAVKLLPDATMSEELAGKDCCTSKRMGGSIDLLLLKLQVFSCIERSYCKRIYKAFIRWSLHYISCLLLSSFTKSRYLLVVRILECWARKISHRQPFGIVWALKWSRDRKMHLVDFGMGLDFVLTFRSVSKRRVSRCLTLFCCFFVPSSWVYWMLPVFCGKMW